MAVRRSVLGGVHVDRVEAAKSDFDTAIQTLITESACARFGHLKQSAKVSDR